jgi:hypothetical protein
LLTSKLYRLVGAGIVRTIFISRGFGVIGQKDWNLFNSLVACIAEANAGILCACAPSLRYIFGNYFRSPDTTTDNSTIDEIRNSKSYRKGLLESSVKSGSRVAAEHEFDVTGLNSISEEHQRNPSTHESSSF